MINCTDRRFKFLCIVAGVLMFLTAGATHASPPWAGNGKYRILVRVEARDIGTRVTDEMPARIHIIREEVQKRFGTAGKINVGSIQVAQYEPNSGEPVPYGKWHYASESWEVPYRWYDETIPSKYPEVVGNLDTQTGKLQVNPQHNWGYFYETQGDWNAGNLAWIHTQHKNKPSYYAFYFDMLPADSQPDAVPRVGFIGDGTERIEENPPSTHGLLLSRVDAADWNGDGLTDLLVGCERGGMLFYPNRGTKQQPRFVYPKLVFTTDGKPLDVGFNSSPVIVDWDGDGNRDLVSGAYPDRVVWFRNTGSNVAPALEYKGLVLVDGKPLSLPNTPVPEGEGIYSIDYFPTLAAADWDGDSDDDLLAGGYITGMIFLFENVGRGTDGLPILKPRGPIEVDGKPIDTAWCAAPGVGDFDGDGDLDLVTGSMAMTVGGGDSTSDNALHYFKNVGTRSKPRLMKQEFPAKGKLPHDALAGPRPIDMNDDGLLDLVIARTTDVSIYYNVGQKNEPLWEYSPPLPGKWRSAPLFGWATQLLDWNGDSRFDIVHGFTLRFNSKKGNPEFFDESQSITGPGENIFHKSPTGDQWTFTHVTDLDGDGKRDILYGVHEGWVYLHRNLSEGDDRKFDTVGVRLNMKDGNPIKVGPRPGQKLDFDVLQGARTTLAAADFDRDGHVDLVVGDNYGVLRYYRNLSGGVNPIFAAPEVVAEFPMRVVPTIADWDNDGWPDVLAGSSQSYLVANNGKPDGPRFQPAQLFQLPGECGNAGGVLVQIPGSPEWKFQELTAGAGLYLPYETVINAADWNDDGDTDLLALASYGYLCWFDRSFLEHGYAVAEVKQWDVR